LEYNQPPTNVVRKATGTILVADTAAVVEADAEQTPRAPRLTSLNILSTAASPVSSASTTTTSDSGATERSYWSNRSSPSKRAVLGNLIQPITFPVFIGYCPSQCNCRCRTTLRSPATIRTLPGRLPRYREGKKTRKGLAESID
jgi:hypothetical protein